MRRNWRKISYLRTGTARQRAAALALDKLGVFEDLAAYQPVLAGTIPLDIDIPGSDLDILCCAQDLERFALQVNSLYGRFEGFQIKIKTISGLPSVITRFRSGSFPVEIFAQDLPAAQQRAYRHMLAEARLLGEHGEARERIRALKMAGLKTEPAFAEVFGLPGDPYEALLALA